MTLFLTGDNFQRKLTAKDANRMLKVAQEKEAGAGNLTTKDVMRAWNNNHILVKWDATYKLYAGSPIGINNPTTRYTYGEGYPRYAQELNIYPGARLKIKKHWFRYGIAQTTAKQGEIIPVAISGNTMGFVDGASMEEGGRVGLLDTEQLQFSYFDFSYLRSNVEYGTSFGHAVLIKGSGATIPRSRALVRLNDRNIIWRAVLNERVSTTEFNGFLSAYPTQTGSGRPDTPISDIKIFDPFGIMPNTSLMPTGAIGVYAGVEITQKIEVGSGETLPDITAYIVCVDRQTMLTGVEMSP